MEGESPAVGCGEQAQAVVASGEASGLRTTSALPPLPPQPQQPQQVYVPTVPAISQLLISEAEAWRALLSLHGGISSLANTLASTAVTDSDETEVREAQYVAGVSALVTACDNLAAQVTKLRSLRRTKRNLETQAGRLALVMQSHENEICARAESTSRLLSLDISSVTAKVRATAQHQKSQIAQLRSLLQAIEQLSATELPANSRIVVGIQQHDQAPRIWSVSDFLQRVYSHGGLHEGSISKALCGEESAYQTTTFERRSASSQDV